MKKSPVATALIVIGALLLLAAAGLLAFSLIERGQAANEAGQIVSQLRTLLPEPQITVMEDGRDPGMATLQISGTNFIGLVEIPAYRAELPAAAAWNEGRLNTYFCRYAGSLYNGSLILGASDSAGLFDFVSKITVDDAVYFTDAEGLCYVYHVKSVKHVKNVDSDTLAFDGLTLFIKSTASFEYVVVYCA